MTAQVFLFSALILGIRGGDFYVGNGLLERVGYIQVYSVYYPMLELLGLVVAVTVLFGVWGAFLRIASWEAQKIIYLNIKNNEICKCSMRGGGYLIHWFGMLPGLFIPSLSVVVWIIMLVNHRFVVYVCMVFWIEDCKNISDCGVIVLPTVLLAYLIFLSTVFVEQVSRRGERIGTLIACLLSSAVYIFFIYSFGASVLWGIVHVLCVMVASFLIALSAMLGGGLVVDCEHTACQINNLNPVARKCAVSSMWKTLFQNKK